MIHRHGGSSVKGLSLWRIWGHARSWNKDRLVLNGGTRACPTRRRPSRRSSGETSTPWARPGKRGDLLSWHPVWSILTLLSITQATCQVLCAGTWQSWHQGPAPGNTQRLPHPQSVTGHRGDLSTGVPACSPLCCTWERVSHLHLQGRESCGHLLRAEWAGELPGHRPVPLSIERLPGLQ